MAGITTRTISALMERTGVLEGSLLAEAPQQRNRYDAEKKEMTEEHLGYMFDMICPAIAGEKVSVLVKAPRDDAYPARFKAFQAVAFDGLDEWGFKQVYGDAKHYTIRATATAAKQGGPAKAAE